MAERQRRNWRLSSRLVLGLAIGAALALLGPQFAAISQYYTSPTECDPGYPDVCIPRAPPNLDCLDVPYVNIKVDLERDPHELDDDGDGTGCEGAEKAGAVSNLSPVAGGTVVFSGSGFDAGIDLRLFFLSHFQALGTTIASGDGGFVVQITIPAGTSGPHELVAKGTAAGTDLAVIAPVNVQAAATTTQPTQTGEAAPASPLPASGQNTTRELAISLALLFIGGMLTALQIWAERQPVAIHWESRTR